MVNIRELMYESFMNGMYQSFIIVGPYYRPFDSGFYWVGNQESL